MFSKEILAVLTIIFVFRINADYPGDIKGPSRLDDKIVIVGEDFAGIHMRLY